MRLDDLDVDAVAESARRDVQQLEAEIDPDAHVGGVHDGYVAGGVLQRRELIGGQAGGADHHRAPHRPTRFGMLDGRLGQGEVDADVGDREGAFERVLDRHADLAMPATAPASVPTKELSFRSTAAATVVSVSAQTVCTSIRPIRPAAPRIAIGIVSALDAMFALVKF